PNKNRKKTAPELPVFPSSSRPPKQITQEDGITTNQSDPATSSTKSAPSRIAAAMPPISIFTAYLPFGKSHI
ncbi:MAG: hypothetical protein VCE74_09380, partial [Alphaproteobacteria bacterium]